MFSATFTHAIQDQIMGRQIRNRDFTNNVVTSYRNHIFSSLSNDSAGNEMANDKIERIGVVGIKTKNGCFYPGFFSKKRSSLQREITNKKSVIGHETENCHEEYLSTFLIPRTPKFQFVPSGKIEKQGGYHPYYITDDKQPENYVEFPTLSDLLAQQANAGKWSLKEQIQYTRRATQKNPTEKIDTPAPDFLFCLRDGPEVKLRELLGTGVWRVGEADNFFVGGIFDFEGRFMSAYFLSNFGFLIPGESNNNDQFIPTCKYSLNSDEFMVPEKTLHEELMQELSDIETVIHLPRAKDLRVPDQKTWLCVKDGVLMSDPLSITILSDAVVGEHMDTNVYAGGDISDGQLYLYGKYDRDGLFIPGNMYPVHMSNFMGRKACRLRAI